MGGRGPVYRALFFVGWLLQYFWPLLHAVGAGIWREPCVGIAVNYNYFRGVGCYRAALLFTVGADWRQVRDGGWRSGLRSGAGRHKLFAQFYLLVFLVRGTWGWA